MSLRISLLLTLLLVPFFYSYDLFGDSKIVKRTGKTCRNATAYLATEVRDASGKDSNIYVVDTNQFYNDPSLLERLGDRSLVIPRSQVAEIDKHKKGFDQRAQTARTVGARIRKLLNSASSAQKIPLKQGGDLSLMEVSKDFPLPSDLDLTNPDHRLIALGLELKEKYPKRKIVVVTSDNAMAIVAKSVGLEIDEVSIKVDRQAVEEMSEGAIMLQIDEEARSIVMDRTTTRISLAQARKMGLPKKNIPHQNQYIVFDGIDMETGKNFDLERALSLVWRFNKDTNEFVPVRRREIAGLIVKPRNFEQVIALDVLLNNEIKLVTIFGKAGTGKTLMTLSAAMAQSKLFRDKPVFDRVILTRANEVTGKDLGFLPGNLKEKMEPLVAPFRDNLKVWIEVLREQKNFILRNSDAARGRSLGKGLSMDDFLDGTTTVDEIAGKLMTSSFISVEAITYSRGRSWNNTLLIIDEAQNLTAHELKTIVTRAGEGTKVILMGDIAQIDNKALNHANNGLTIAAARFSADGWRGHAHVSLIEGERSELATKAADLLGD